MCQLFKGDEDMCSSNKMFEQIVWKYKLKITVDIKYYRKKVIQVYRIVCTYI